MKLAVLTCGMLPIPAVKGGAVENLIDFYLEYNDIHKLHDITVYSPWDPKVKVHQALSSDINHYIYTDVTSIKAKIERRLYKYLHPSEEYYNYFIEYYFEKVYADLSQKNYDYIILENGAGLAYKLSQRGHKNLILHMHNELQQSKEKYHQTIFKNITKILTVSDYIKQRVSTLFPIEKIITIHNGIDRDNFTSKGTSHISRRQIGFTEEDFVIVYSGRIIKEKGISELIDAILCLRSYPKIKLLVLGCSFYNEAKYEDDFIRSLKDKTKEIKDKIYFTGFIPYQNVPDYMHLANIAVLPSMWEEPFGLTIVEAMATGLPLITTRSGGIPEICEGVATIIDRHNASNNIANAILDLYNHPNKSQQMSIASLERSKLFDKDVYAYHFFDAFKDLC